MTKLTATQKSPSLIKMILMGFSGTGKTTAYIPLSIPEIVPNFPGLELRILDYDGKAEEVARHNLAARLDKRIANKLRLTSITQEQHDAALNNLDIEVLREKTKASPQGGITIIGAPQSWKRTISTLERWTKTASPASVLIPDSLTYAAQTAIIAYAQALQGNSFGDPLSWKDYGIPQGYVRNFLTVLADSASHVILTAHQESQDITQKTGEFITKPDGNKEAIEEVIESVMTPISIGSKGRVTIPAQFNHMLATALGPNNMRRLYTTPADGIITKTPFFACCADNYLLDKGMVEYFMLRS